MNITQELKSFAEQMSANAPKEVLQIIGAEIENLINSGVVEKALKVGDHAPDFELQDSDGNTFRINDLTRAKKVIVSFTRGNWCPFCNIEFKHLQNELQNAEKSGYELIVISPQLPKKSAELKKQNGYDFPILYDRDNKVAEQFGITFTLAESLRPIHAAFNMNIPEHNGDESFILPIPATYVLDKGNLITHAYVNPNWMERADIKSLII